MRINTVLERIARALIVASLFPVLAASSAWGVELLNLSDASRRVDGVDAGRPSAAALAGGWSSSVPSESTESSDYLYFDLAGKSLNPNEGSVVITVHRGELAATTGETLFSFAGQDWGRKIAFSVVWKDDPGLGVTGLLDLLVPLDPLQKEIVPAKGQPLTIAFAWKGSAFQVLANGREQRYESAPGADKAAFVKAITESRYLVLGGLPDPSMPKGAWEPISSKIVALGLYDTFDGWRSQSSIASVAAEKDTYGAGEEIVVTLRGTPDRAATFSIQGVAERIAMEELDDGVYVGKVAVPAGLSVGGGALTGTLTNSATGQSTSLSGRSITIDSTPPEGIRRIVATVPWAGEIAVTWDASPSSDVDHYRVYRGEGKDPHAAGQPFEDVRGEELVDTRVVPGLDYHYAVVPVDQAGNAGPSSDVVSATAVAGDGPKITSISAEPQGRPLRPGAVVTLSVSGESGGRMAVDLGALAGPLALTEEGRSGRYAGTYVVKDADVQPMRSLHRVVAHLADALGVSDLAGPELAVIGLEDLNDRVPPVVTKVAHDGWQVAGISGKLVAGDRVTVNLEGEPAGYASFELSEVAGRVAMKELSPGVYSGSFVVPQGAEGGAVPLVAYLADEGGNETTAQADRLLAFDTRVRLTVTAKDGLLPADRKSQTTLTAKATNANGDNMLGQELALTLSTTEEYTGVVGGGDIGGRRATMEDVDDVEVRWGGVTDNFGEVSATYTAGFAAKTALVVAKDLTTGDVGAGWLNTYVASTVAIELVPRAQKGAADRAVLRISADPGRLTADGRSTSRVTVWLTDLAGTPLSGVRVAFALGNQNGRLKILRGTTDGKGIAEAEYRAGTSIGAVTVTASAADYGVTGMVQIVLLADAPAKIDLVASAVKLVANGSDTAKLSIRVSDIHDNPNDNVPVTFAVLQGSGKVAAPAITTDRHGEGSAIFTAGNTAGTAVIEARHTSRAPTEDELRRIYGTIFLPRLYERQERDRTTVTDWLVKPGDKVEKGQALVTVDTRSGPRTLVAPVRGVFVRLVKRERDRAELGDTIGYVEIDPTVWKNDYSR
ncbi:MAG: Ig-like domain-containing protein [Deltaproteobacteria bacterium]|nr:Ig-like domain-containing protein [Deltaproteobacteria bacterium]